MSSPGNLSKAPTLEKGPAGPQAPQPQRTRRIEIPTLCVAAIIYLSFGFVTFYHAALPNWLLALLGGYLVAWHGSLQHEVIHGHPTPWPLVNRLLIYPSLWLILPFEGYRESHLRHHQNENLTDPERDPESYYVHARTWLRIGPIGRGLLLFHNSLLGRLLLGPPIVLLQQIGRLLGHMINGRPKDLRIWGGHIIPCAIVLIWVIAISGLPFWKYILFFVYPGLALTLLRSFAEHRAVPAIEARTAVLQAEWPLALLFLNNNLHALHHQQPGLAWYRLPSVWRATRPGLETQEPDGPNEWERGERFRGYWEIALRYLLWPKESPLHPAERWRLAEPQNGSGTNGGMARDTGKA